VTPNRPERALLERADGTAVPLAFGFYGHREDGTAVWVITSPVELRAFDRIKMGPMDDNAVVMFP
jgi:hypothetical protein